MEVRAYFDGHQDPHKAVIELPDWSLGGNRKVIEISIYEALQLRAELNRMFA